MAKAPTKGGEDAADPQNEVKQPAEAPKPEAKQPDPQHGEAVTDAAQAAALVGIAPDQVFAFRLFETKVVVVTIAGQKLEAAL